MVSVPISCDLALPYFYEVQSGHKISRFVFAVHCSQLASLGEGEVTVLQSKM